MHNAIMPNLTATSSPQAATEAALRLAGRLIDAIGPRPSGSAASRQAADALQTEAAAFADRVWSEDFTVHPGAFLGWIRLLVLLYIAGVALLWLEVSG